MSHVRITLPDTALRSPMGGLPAAQLREAGTRLLWYGALGRWLGRLRERDELSGLSERERRDAGITAYDVAFECRKPLWRD